MNTSLKKLVALLFPLVGALAANSARATDIGLPLLPPGAPYLWAGDLFSLNNSNPLYQNNRQAGDALAGTLAERSDIVAQSTRLHTNPMWTGSNTFVFSADASSPNDGYVIRNPSVAGADGGTLMYIPNKYDVTTNERPHFPIVSTQAAVRVGSSDTVSLGLMENPGEYSGLPIAQQTFAGVNGQNAEGEIWMSLNQSGEYGVFAKDENDVRQTVATGMLSGFNNNAWQALYIAWDNRTNTITVEIGGQKVVDGTSVAQYYPTTQIPNIRGFGFEFSGTAALDNFSAVPEPSSIVMLAMGAAGLGLLGWRRRRAVQSGIAFAQIAA